MADEMPTSTVLVAPRLQLRWERNDDPDWNWLCHYELVLPLHEHDIRREDADGDAVRDEKVVSLGTTRSSTEGGHIRGGEVVTPYRDGAHAKWDAGALGLPVYAMCDGVVTLHKAAPSLKAENERLRAELAKAERKFEICRHNIDRWLPCPDHRDKTERGHCMMCEIERLRAALQRIEAGEFLGISTMIVHGNWQGVATMFQQIARAALSEGK